MEITLKSQDKINEIAILNLDSGDVTLHLITESPEFSNKPKQGYFSVIKDKVVCFYRLGTKLYYRLGQDVVEFQDNDTVYLQSLPNDYQSFSVERNNKSIYSAEYNRPKISPPISVYQVSEPMISEEDFDIFVLIRNVINNKARMKRVFINKDEPH